MFLFNQITQSLFFLLQYSHMSFILFNFSQHYYFLLLQQMNNCFVFLIALVYQIGLLFQRIIFLNLTFHFLMILLLIFPNGFAQLLTVMLTLFQLILQLFAISFQLVIMSFQFHILRFHYVIFFIKFATGLL